MIRPPPRTTRTDTLFPYTTLFRSVYVPMFRPSLSRQYDPPIVVPRPYRQRRFPGSDNQLCITRQIAATHPQLFQPGIGKFNAPILPVAVYLCPRLGPIVRPSCGEKVWPFV